MVNLVHLHLLLNHVPTIGTIVALGLLLLAFAKKSNELTRASLAIFFAIALVSLPTYMTGYSAQRALKDRPGISAPLVEQHQSAARFPGLDCFDSRAIAIDSHPEELLK